MAIVIRDQNRLFGKMFSLEDTAWGGGSFSLPASENSACFSLMIPHLSIIQVIVDLQR